MANKLTFDGKKIIRGLLDKATVARDALPYTGEFAELKKQFENLSDRKLSDTDFWHALIQVGKGGGRSGTKKPRSPSPKLSDIERLEIYRLLPDGTGPRDRLPYTSAFDEICVRFNELTHNKLNKQEFWRAILRVAKSGPKLKSVFPKAPVGNLHSETVEILEKQNPWWLGKKGRKTLRFRRWSFYSILDIIQGSNISQVVLSGPRRVGKTVIQDQIIEQLLIINKIEPKQILHVQFDLLPWLGAQNQPIISIVKWYEQNVLGMSINEFAQKGKKVYLFFDEIQNLGNWAPELKFIIDHTSEGALGVLATGSSSLRIKRDYNCLAGRVRHINLGPLYISEICGVRGLCPSANLFEGGDKKRWIDKEFWFEMLAKGEKHQLLINKAFDYFSRFGGFPICHDRYADNESQYADLLMDSIVNPIEILTASRTLDKRILAETFKLVCRYPGQYIEVKKIINEINRIYDDANVRKVDIQASLQYLADSMLISLVPSLEIGKKRQSAGEKICLCDHFIRQACLQEVVPISPRLLEDAHESVSTLAGQIIESIIGYNLKTISDLEIAWFPARRTEPEIDYVLTMGLKRLPIEVKYRRGKPKNGDLAGIKKFCSQEKYNAEFGLVITQEYAGAIGNNVIAIPASIFLAAF
ncbi:MAG: ATP-binding protein [Thermoguttaceae bacterium]